MVALSPHARADGLDFDVVGARSIGRAGVSTVSEDGLASLWVNPGGMARRSEPRLQLGVSLHDSDRSMKVSDPASPEIIDRGSLVAAPQLGVQLTAGRLVLGVALAERGELDRRLPEPQRDQAVTEISQYFPHRYAGIGLRYLRRSVAVGAAARATHWLGIGASIGLSTVSIQETRRVWAGFGGRDMPVGTPTRDLELIVDASDRLVPEAAAGALIAPPSVPLELALSIAYTGSANLRGDASLLTTRSQAYPAPTLDAPASRLDRSATVEVRAGLRYLGDRLYAEAGSRLSVLLDTDSEWALDGVQVRDDTGRIGSITDLPSLVDRRDHATCGAALDVEVVRGFLWLTAGYQFRTAATRRERISAVHGDVATHTLAAGAEGHWNDITLSVGYARSFSRSITVSDSAVMMFNPLDAETIVTGNGRYDAARDLFGLSLEVAWK